MLSARRVVGLGVLTIALIGCRGSSAARDSAAPKASPVPTPMGELVEVDQIAYANWGHRDARDEKERDLDAGDFYFKGTFIQGEPGQQLTLKIRNVAGQVHNFSLPEQGLDQDLPAKRDRVNIAVTFPQSGSLQFFCKLHTARGMNGQLLIGAEALASPSPVSSPQPVR